MHSPASLCDRVGSFLAPELPLPPGPLPPPAPSCCSELREVLAPAEVHLPNGMAWDEARGLIFYADSGAETIVEYQTDAQVWRWTSAC